MSDEIPATEGDAFDRRMMERALGLARQAADMGEIPVGGYTNVVTSVCGAGRITEAVTNAIELADHVTKLTGASTIVSLNRTGPYGQVTWSTSYPGMASFEAAQGAVDADPDWPGMVDRLTGGGVFTPDPMASMQSMYLRLH